MYGIRRISGHQGTTVAEWFICVVVIENLMLVTNDGGAEVPGTNPGKGIYLCGIYVFYVFIYLSI
jgi:hypothetical protein